jgi:hypothetical protein
MRVGEVAQDVGISIENADPRAALSCVSST